MITNMKKMFSVLAGVLMATAMMAQGEPVITFEKTSHDFGKINEADGRVTTVFNFKNEGMSPLVLSNVRASCGCTTPKWTREPIEPGATGAITVTYNPNGRPGRFSKTITVTSNAVEGTTRLYIKGEVIPKPAKPVNKYPYKVAELSISDKNINFGDVYKGKAAMQTLEYANQTQADITVEGSYSNDLNAVATLAEVKPGQSGTLNVEFNTAACNTYGPYKETFYLKVNGKTEQTETYAITMVANVKEDFSQMTEDQKLHAPIAEVGPEVNLGILPKGKSKVSKVFPLVNAGDNALLIRRIIAADDMAFYAPKTGLKSGKKALKITVNTTNMAATKYQRNITIITNDPKNPVKNVKLVWEVQ